MSDSLARVFVDMGLVVLSGIICSANVRRQSVLSLSVCPSPLTARRFAEASGIPEEFTLVVWQIGSVFMPMCLPSRATDTHIPNLKLQMCFNPLLGPKLVTASLNI